MSYATPDIVKVVSELMDHPDLPVALMAKSLEVQLKALHSTPERFIARSCPPKEAFNKEKEEEEETIDLSLFVKNSELGPLFRYLTSSDASSILKYYNHRYVKKGKGIYWERKGIEDDMWEQFVKDLVCVDARSTLHYIICHPALKPRSTGDGNKAERRIRLKKMFCKLPPNKLPHKSV